MRWYLIVVTDLLRRINKSLQKKKKKKEKKKHACMKNPTCNMVEVFELEEAFGSWYKCLLRERRSLVREFSNVRSQSKIARNFWGLWSV